MEAVYLSHTRKLMLFRHRFFDVGPHMEEANAEHREMLEAILSGEPERARRLGERHGLSGRARLLKAIAYQAPQDVGA